MVKILLIKKLESIVRRKKKEENLYSMVKYIKDVVRNCYIDEDDSDVVIVAEGDSTFYKEHNVSKIYISKTGYGKGKRRVSLCLKSILANFEKPTNVDDFIGDLEEKYGVRIFLSSYNSQGSFPYASYVRQGILYKKIPLNVCIEISWKKFKELNENNKLFMLLKEINERLESVRIKDVLEIFSPPSTDYS